MLFEIMIFFSVYGFQVIFAILKLSTNFLSKNKFSIYYQTLTI